MNVMLGAPSERASVNRHFASVTDVWHGHCTIQANWDFIAQFENETLPGHVFRARQRSISRLVGQPPICTGPERSRPGSTVATTGMLPSRSSACRECSRICHTATSSVKKGAELLADPGRRAPGRRLERTRAAPRRSRPRRRRCDRIIGAIGDMRAHRTIQPRRAIHHKRPSAPRRITGRGAQSAKNPA
ncbi:hypothetical protein ACVMGC_002913 [Bradyrhizobium barranii subsp. barranii]